MRFVALDIAGAATILFLAVGGVLLLDIQTGRELEDVRALRVTLEARRAATEYSRPDGDLTIVRGVTSERWYFLNKHSYVVHTSSPAREGTVLSDEVVFDMGRADRHAEVLRRKVPLRTQVGGSAWRVTVPANELSAELVMSPPVVPAPKPWRFGLLALLAGGVVMLILRLKAPITLAAALGTLTTGTLLVLVSGEHLEIVSAIASRYLAEGGQGYPIVTIPATGAHAWLIGLTAVAFGFVIFSTSRAGARAFDALSREREAWLAISPGLAGLLVFVAIPLVFGIGLSLFRHVHGTFTFVGFANYASILSSPPMGRAFGYVATVTAIWVVLNVVLQLAIGLMLALILHNRVRHVQRIYRALLVLPWAMPAYVTALVWRGMLDTAFGGSAWMEDSVTAFFANLAASVWLGFPFIMVVCLGALAAIPRDLFEAAQVDGAGWQRRMFSVTLPLLRPAVLPAVVLASLWTFNRLEVVYLVSEGGPDGSTEILVTEVYRWAFERGIPLGGAYGYASAYSVLLLAILLVYGWMTSRISEAAGEGPR